MYDVMRRELLGQVHDFCRAFLRREETSFCVAIYTNMMYSRSQERVPSRLKFAFSDVMGMGDL